MGDRCKSVDVLSFHISVWNFSLFDRYAHMQPETSSHSLHNQVSRYCPNRSFLTLSHGKNLPTHYLFSKKIKVLLFHSDLNRHHNHYSNNSNQRWKDPHSSCAQTLCPNVNYQGQCKLIKRGDSCRYLHYQMCDLCHSSVLHPTNRIQREEHRQVREIIHPIFSSNIT